MIMTMGDGGEPADMLSWTCCQLRGSERAESGDVLLLQPLIGLVRAVGVRVSVVGLRIGSREREVVRKGKGALNLWEACGWGAQLGES